MRPFFTRTRIIWFVEFLVSTLGTCDYKNTLGTWHAISQTQVRAPVGKKKLVFGRKPDAICFHLLVLYKLPD
jgi:hypothetical protein